MVKKILLGAFILAILIGCGGGGADSSTSSGASMGTEGAWDQMKWDQENWG